LEAFRFKPNDAASSHHSQWNCSRHESALCRTGNDPGSTGGFERLKRTYGEARYSDSYAITADDLDALATSIARLRDIVEEVCRERLAALKAETEAWMSASADARVVPSVNLQLRAACYETDLAGTAAPEPLSEL